MNFPLYIARRYVRSKSSQNAVNIINAVTFGVIVIGSAALFIVLSGFAGLKTFSLSFSNTFDPDMRIVPASGKTFAFGPEQAAGLRDIPGIASYSRELEERVYLTHDQRSMIAYIKGVDSAYNRTTGIDSTIYMGLWDLSAQQAVSGISIASQLSLSVQNYRSPLIVLVPKPGTGNLSPQGLGDQPYNQMAVILSGIYQIEEGLDKKYLFADLGLVQALLERDSLQVSGVNLRLTPEADEAAVLSAVRDTLGSGVEVRTRRQLNQTLYRMLNTENLATYLIFTLVLIIALFNVVGAIIMMILDKQLHTRTLYSLGLTVRQLRRIYFLQGVLVTCAGGVIGVLIGVALIGSQLAFGWLMITPSLAYPVALSWANVGIVLATIAVLGVIAARIASNRINKKMLSL
ncbi:MULTISPECIES: ABC transporter permease [Robiginitalea]|uniref:ABC transporter permease n=1 Tax=Robiginitalea TaxID=252306 RepID=UPI002349E4F5|nr:MULTISPECIES: FtsX-like permease family protein [unclassified Robiginitalea]MDC6353133.1 FtsX-like permease family protein [Robiginitalea sp. PM2]MDC6373700.1 FtsX-like permease family protein [Robiginitalea sp. SP8]